jgi:2'-5' RNA ligase
MPNTHQDQPDGLHGLLHLFQTTQLSITSAFRDDDDHDDDDDDGRYHNWALEQSAVLQHTAGAIERERFAPREGESATWGPGRDRIVRALSMGHLHIEDAAQLGYGRGSGEGMDEDRRDGWQTLPRQLWHTTTNVDQARQGLKTRAEMGMRHGQGLGGGADNTISLTDSREHAHNMLAGLREYHDVLTGKTPLSQLEEHARTGHGAQRGPYLDYQHSMTGYPEPDRHSMMRGMRHIPDLMTDAEASQRGLHPHPTNHHRARIGDMGGGWERPATPEELSYDRSEIFKAHVNARRFAGGPRPILFMSNDPHALAQKRPEDFAVLRVSSRPGAQGYRIKGEHEWRTGTGDALHVHGTDAPPDGGYHPTPGFPHTAGGKPWLPHDRFFGPGHHDLDPRLFDSTHLKGPWRRALLGLVNRAFADYTYRDPASWQRWARAYLAGSQASHWYGNNDLDVLVGIDYAAFRRAQPRYRAMSDREIDEMLNARAHEVCDPARWFTIGGEHLGPWDSTVYVNADSYDIRRIKPYAAYDLSEDRWAVEPVKIADDFGPDKLPGADFLYARSLASQVRALKKLPSGQAQALGAALYDKLHGERHDAFSGQGGGLFDVRNVAWKYLALHPEKPMEKLVAWKRGEQQQQPLSISAMVKIAALPNPEADHESNEGAQRDEWFHGTHHDFDKPQVDEDAERRAQAKDWNTSLGTHWTSRHDVADRIAQGLPGETEFMSREDRGRRQQSARTLHARLRIANPKRYASEYHMDREVYGHEYEQGNHPSRHNPKHLQDYAGDPHLGHEQDLRHFSDWEQPHHHEDWYDEEDEFGGDARGRFSWWLSRHPDRYNIAQRFKQRLIDAGHDGIVYGNEYEGRGTDAEGHSSAITFHPHQAEVAQAHPAGWDCLDDEEAEEYRHDHPGHPRVAAYDAILTHTAGMKGPGSDADFNDDSAMIAIVPPRDLAERLVVDNGEPVEQMHVTLAYIPHVPAGQLGRLTGTVAEWASRQRPITARVQGAGTFVSTTHVLWAAVDMPGSSHLHASLVDALRAAGFPPSADHGFTPHLTLQYSKYHVRFLPKITPESFTAHSVYVCQGDNWRPVPFSGATAGKV